MITLKNNTLQASLDPNGACLTSFQTIDNIDILRGRAPTKTDPLLSACFPCIPYFGRIAGGLIWKGKHYPLKPTHQGADQDHAIHGEGWMNIWTVTEQTDTRAVFTFKTEKDTQNLDGLFPFAFEAEQITELHSDRLMVTLSLTNLHEQQAPFGLGLHPFFYRAPSTQLKFHYDEIHTPPNFAPLDRKKIPFPSGARLPETLIDHSFVGGNGSVFITGDHGQNYHLQFDAPYLHIYAPPEQNYFCLEPITQLPGAFDQSSIDHSHVLKKGDKQTLTMSIKTLSESFVSEFK